MAAASGSPNLWKKVLIGLVLGVLVGLPATFSSNSSFGILAPSDAPGCLWQNANTDREGVNIVGTYNNKFAPDEVVNGVINPLKDSLRGIEGIKGVKASFVEKANNKFAINIGFPADFNADEATAKIKTAIDKTPVRPGVLVAEKPFDVKADNFYTCRTFYKDATTYLKQLGVIFINLIMMIVAPLIFFSLVSGINNMSDSKTLGRIGKKATAVYMLTCCFAVALGIVIGLVFKPGIGVDLSSMTSGSSGGSKGDLPVLVKVILDMVPHNALGALSGAEGKPSTIQTVFFAIFVGITLNLMGEKGAKLVDICHAAAQLMFKIIGYIIKLSPYAVFGLMAWVSSHLGIEAILQLGYFVVATITGMGIHYFVLGLLIIVIAKISPLPFYAKSLEYQALAFSTSSSKATLATSMQVAEEKMGTSKGITGFVLPLGAAINMDGTAIYLGLTAIFFAQAYGIDLSMHHYLLIIFTSTIASIGAAGYPGGSLVMMSLVLDTIGVPTAGIALLVGVDRILDMCRTTINITSDVAITLIIDKTENSLDQKRYYAKGAELGKLIEKAAKK